MCVWREKWSVCVCVCVCVKGETVVCMERDIGLCGGRHKCLYMGSNLGRGVEGEKGLRLCCVE